MNTLGKWIWKVYYYLFIYSFSFHYSVVNSCVEIRNLHFCSPFHKWICASKSGTPLCSSMSALVCSSTQGVWIFLSYTGKILTIKNLEHVAFWHGFDEFVVMTIIHLEQELCWNTEGFWMMLLIVGCCHYFVVLKEVCGVGLRLQALVQNPISAEVGKVTSFFHFLLN